VIFIPEPILQGSSNCNSSISRSLYVLSAGGDQQGRRGDAEWGGAQAGSAAAM